jgi:hypothetical protein
LAQKQDNAMQPGYYQNHTVTKTGVTRTQSYVSPGSLGLKLDVVFVVGRKKNNGYCSRPAAKAKTLAK